MATQLAATAARREARGIVGPPLPPLEDLPEGVQWGDDDAASRLVAGGRGEPTVTAA